MIAGSLQVDASVVHEIGLGNLYIISTSLLYLFSMFKVRNFARVDFLEPSSTHNCARRRRERRLRMHWRHERLSVAMALADALHHSAQPRVKPGKAVQYDAPRRQMTPPDREAEFYAFGAESAASSLGGTAAGVHCEARGEHRDSGPRCSDAAGD